MNRHELRFAVLAVLAVAVLFGCGEKSFEPGEHYAALDPAAMGGAGAGRGMDPDELNIKGTLLVASRGGIFATNTKGDAFLFSSFGSATASVEVEGTRIFAQTIRDIYEFDHAGNIISTVPVPDWIGYASSFTALPGGDFAVHDCGADSVYFIDAAGGFLEAVAMPEPSPMRLQVMRGLVRDGKLFVSETGTKKIAEIDLATYDVTVLKEFDPAQREFLGDLEHLGRYYYVARPMAIERFTETSDPEEVAVFEDQYNVTGIAIVKHHAYVTLNFEGKVYRVNLSSGKTKLVLEDLDYPLDIEFLPVELEPPPGPRRVSFTNE